MRRCCSLHSKVRACTPIRQRSCCSRLQVRPFSNAQHLSSSRPTVTSKDIVFSGIQPTGIPHLGNWLGALQQWNEIQKTQARLFFSIVDLHAITVPQPRDQLRQWRRESLATLVAIGLDPERSSLFFQSAVPAHTELMWILSCTSSLGYLSRMTTWKSKASIPEGTSALDAAAKSTAKLGLLAYPVLQAADILVHGATFVPVGADQVQHLEFARECARNFNAAHGKHILKEPQHILSSAARVMSLRDPGQKMSKSSSDPKSRILLTDTRDVVQAKVKASLTDSLDGITYEPDRRPGIANLISILSYVDGSKLLPEEHAARLSSHSLRALKEVVAEAVSTRLEPIRERYLELTASRRGEQVLDDIAERGAASAQQNASVTMVQVREVLGMR